MASILLKSWNPGFNKVGLTLLLREKLGYSLKQAKMLTDSVLNKQPVVIEVPDEYRAEVVQNLEQIGVVFVSSLS